MATDWPSWPEGDAGEVLLDLEVSKNIDELFLMIFGGLNEYRSKFIETSGFTNYETTEWKPSIKEAGEGEPSTKLPTSMADLKVGMACRRKFIAPSPMGSQYPTNEMMHIEEHDSGKHYLLENCIITNAPYGDKFRAILRQSLDAIDAKTTRFSVRFALVYIAKVNGMIKGMILKGAKDGMVKSLKNQEMLIKEYAPVRPFGAPPSPTARAASPSPAGPLLPPGGADGAPPAMALLGTSGRLPSIFGMHLVEALSPWASFLHALLAHLPLLHGLTPDGVLAVLLCVTSLSALRVGLAFLRFLQSAGTSPTDIFAWIAFYTCSIIHIPSSVFEMLTTYGIIHLLKFMINTLADAMPSPPSAAAGSSSAQARRASTPTSGASTRRGTAFDGEASGVKYDGYHQAIASAAPHFGESSRRGSNVQLEAINQRSEVALEQIRKGLNRVAAPFTPRDDSVHGTGGSSTTSFRPVKHALQNHCHQVQQQHRGRKHARNATKNGTGKPRTPSASKSPLRGTHQPLVSLSSLSFTKRFSSATTTTTTTTTPGGGDVASSRNDGAPQDPRSHTAPTSPLDPGSEGHDMSHPLEEQHLIFEGYCPPDLPPILRSNAVVEVVYENQRLQPFRGWGSTWPGHFLPTDKILRYSVRDSYGEDITTSQEIDEVCPVLPPQWRWAESGWYLDLSGVLSDSTDNEGWAYGLDFQYVLYPFARGTGRKKIADFVRRRRWLRTRVPNLGDTDSPTKEEGKKQNPNQPTVENDLTTIHSSLIINAVPSKEMDEDKEEEERENDDGLLSSSHKEKKESLTNNNNDIDTHHHGSDNIPPPKTTTTTTATSMNTAMQHNLANAMTQPIISTGSSRNTSLSSSEKTPSIGTANAVKKSIPRPPALTVPLQNEEEDHQGGDDDDDDHLTLATGNGDSIDVLHGTGNAYNNNDDDESQAVELSFNNNTNEIDDDDDDGVVEKEPVVVLQESSKSSQAPLSSVYK